MAEAVLPGVYIEVRPEALIVPGAITVGNIGIVGTARRGPLGEATILGSYAETRQVFGSYDPFNAPDTPGQAFTLVRALEQAYANGASTVFAVRIAGAGVSKASLEIASAGGLAVTLSAKTEGVWGNDISIEIEADGANVRVILKYGAIEELYTVSSGDDLVTQINQTNTGSGLVDAEPDAANSAERPDVLGVTSFANGNDGGATSDADYALGLEKLLNENTHIMLAAGQDDMVIGNELTSHVAAASTDKVKRERIAVIGSRANASLADITSHSLSSDRVIFVAPGIKVTDSATGEEVVLPGAYAAAAVAGMLSARSPHVSLTNKTISVGGLETKFSLAQLEQMVLASVLALEVRRGFRTVKGITTDKGAFRQITTRRIVDFAKFGVRSAADPYIGLLNNDRVRKALKGTINGFLASMIDREMLVSYELEVSATRAEEIRGIAKVILTLRPTFSIDFVNVVMFLG